MTLRKSILIFVLVSLTTTGILICGKYEESAASERTARPEGWRDKSHGDNVEPDYDIVFPQDKVNRIKITITFPDSWETMQSNMTELFGVQRSGQQGKHPGRINTRNPGIPGWIDMTPVNPVWVPATIEFNGLTWTNVGIRYKGGSSLASGWRSGALKLPFKLDFDEFEDEYPVINNQRFYGFKQLSFSNVFRDSTYMRETIAADIFAEAGLVAAETAYYDVVMDYGKGPVDLGLYIMVEVIDDTVINGFFGDDSGNIYEGNGPGASLAQGTFTIIEGSFLKENNIQKADWSDIEELYNVLHSENRTSNPGMWRKSLESIFDVKVFLKWLAVSAIIQNWDNYGSMPHNFYLYHDPDTGLISWISWDHNEILGIGSGRGMGFGMGDSGSLGREDVGENWPLIRYLLDDPTYHYRYIQYIEETIQGVFNPDRIAKKCHRLAELIAPYATKDFSKPVFESAVEELINRIHERFEAAETFLAAGR